MTIEYPDEVYSKILLDDWRESIASEISNYELSQLNDLCPNLVPFLSREYRGKQGASAESIRVVERRLGLKLPNDYVAFVRLTEEWPAPGLVPPGSRFLAVNEIGLYRNLYPSSYRIWTDDEDGIRHDDQIGVYGEAQLPELFCRRHLESCIAISTQDGSASYVLNPNVTTSTSCEAWLLDFHLPGAVRFQSFFSLIEYEIPRSIAEIGSLLGSY